MEGPEIVTLAFKFNEGKIDGNDLKRKVEENQLTKAQRRKIAKMAKKLHKKSEENGELTERQKLRLLTKEKKKLPKLSRDDRKKKFQSELDKKREQEMAKYTVCLGCRQKGHFVKDCPNKIVSDEQRFYDRDVLCYYCGSRDHALRNCPTKGDSTDLPYAKCFICLEMGHLSKQCSNNNNGLYPKGGSCHICGEITHLARNCPLRDESDEER